MITFNIDATLDQEYWAYDLHDNKVFKGVLSSVDVHASRYNEKADYLFILEDVEKEVMRCAYVVYKTEEECRTANSL